MGSGLHDQTERPGQVFPPETQEIIRHRYEMAGRLAEGKRVLEVGAGVGFGLSYLADRAESLVAGEYDDENIAALERKRAGVCPIMRVDAHALPFPDASFDVLLALAMVYYLSLEAFLAEARRVLRPKGVLFFCTSNKDVPGFWPGPHTTRYYSVPELDRLLKEAGFEPSFSGAFPAPGSLLRRRFRAMVKDTLKRCVLCLPGGGGLWGRLRGAGAAGGVPLPPDVERMTEPRTDVVPLAPDRVERTHRVVYVTARVAP